MNSFDTLRKELDHFIEIVEDKADKEMSGLRNKAEKRMKDTDKRLSNILNDGGNFKEEITQDTQVMDKYSHKIFETVESTINQIIKPEKINLDSLEKYTETCRSALNEQDQILIKYVKLLKGPKYKGRVKALSKSLLKLNGDLTKLERFILEDYAPYADIERTTKIIKDILEQITEYEKIKDELLSKESLVLEKDNELESLYQELQVQEHHPIKEKTNQINEHYQNMQRDIDQKFSNIRKGLRKYEKYLSKGKEKQDTTLMREFITDAATSMASQSTVQPFISMLTGLRDNLDNQNLGLKKDKKDAARKDIDNFLNGQIKTIWDDIHKVYNERSEIEAELKQLDIENKIEKISSNISALKRDRNRIIEREIRKEEEIREGIEKLKTEIDNRMNPLVNNYTNLIIQFDKFPAWVNILN